MKGFSLIELLAAIVILSVIILIAQPIVTGVIDNSRKEAFESSVRSLIKSIDTDAFLTGNMNGVVQFDFSDGVVTSSRPGFNIDFKGKSPDNGRIIIVNGKISVAVNDGVNCVKKNADESDFQVFKYVSGNCTVEEEHIAGTGHINAYYSAAENLLLLARLGDSLIKPDYQLVYQNMSLDENNLGVIRSFGSYNSSGIFFREGVMDDVDFSTINLIVSEGIEVIGDGLIRHCLKSVRLPSTLISIGDYMFPSCNIELIGKLPPNLEYLGEGSISGISFDISAISNLNSLEYIGDRVFEYKGLEAIILPPNLKEIGYHAFWGNSLTNINIPNTVTHLGGFGSNQLTSVTIPDSVIEIESAAFRQNQLTSVSIPNSVTVIRNYAFENNQLSEVTIPASVREIESYAFAENNFTTINIPATLSLVSGFNNNKLTSVTIQSGVLEIGNYAFSNNLITSVTIPSSVTRIRYEAFRFNRLPSISIPNGVTIDSNAFQNNLLTSITIGSNVTIGSNAFQNNLLTSITIGSSVSVHPNMLSSSTNAFYVAYLNGGAGTYVGTQNGSWTKQ